MDGEPRQDNARNWAAQGVYLGATLASAWLLMQVVHEFGHVTGAWLTSGAVQRVILHPLAISRTDLKDNPWPNLVSWAGPVLGCVLPLVFWGMAHWRNLAVASWMRFFAGFCLIANGSYLAVGARDRIGDAGDLIRHGSPEGTLYLFGLVTIPVGFWLWNGLGREFGLGKAARCVSWRAAAISSALFVITVLLEVALSSRE